MNLYKHYVPKAEQIPAMIFIYGIGFLNALPILASVLISGSIYGSESDKLANFDRSFHFVNNNPYFFMTLALFIVLSIAQVMLKEHRKRLYSIVLNAAIGEYSRSRRIGYFITMLIVPWSEIIYYYQPIDSEALSVIRGWYDFLQENHYDVSLVLGYLRSEVLIIDNAILCGLLVQSARFQILNAIVLVRTW